MPDVKIDIDVWVALKCVCLAVMSHPTGTGREHWTMCRKAALPTFDIAFDGRLAAGRR